MTILDTNIFSEVVKPRPEPKVIEWLGAQKYHEVYLTAITLAEVRHGLNNMPAGKRQAQLHDAVEALFENEFAGRILPFDEAASFCYAQLVVERARAGRPVQAFDAQIAAIARARGATVATRNTKDFEQCGVALVNPWTKLS